MALADCRHTDWKGSNSYHPMHCSPKQFCEYFLLLEDIHNKKCGTSNTTCEHINFLRLQYEKFVEANKSRNLICKQNPVTMAPEKPNLQIKFEEYSKMERQRIQSTLKNYGLYKSTIDGIYGKNTKLALEEFNQLYLSNSDLSDDKNIGTLLATILNSENKKISDSSKELENLKEMKQRLGLSFYGSFVHTEKVPNALFFLNDIQQNDRFEFRKALRNHDISFIVLSSLGGSVWEGLSMAAIINDRQLNAYVPKTGLFAEGNCASACSFMFLAGSKRKANGRLGVHQFYSSDATKKDKIGEVQETTQFTVSEIIGYLNEFGTPSWVFERMFQQTEMYFFKKDEIQILETEIPQDLELEFEKAEKFMAEFASKLGKVIN